MKAKSYRLTLRDVNKHTRNHFKVRARKGKRSLNAEINLVLDQVYQADKSREDLISKPVKA